jgi:hypothetical protein
LIGDSWVNALFQDQLDMRALYGAQSDFYDIQYHIRGSVSDALNKANDADPAARALFMSVSGPPTTLMDGLRGSKFTGVYTDIKKVEIDRRSLVDPQFLIALDTVAINPAVYSKVSNKIWPKVILTAQEAFTSPLLLNVALVEDVGNNKNVLRKLLFGPDGMTITNAVAKGEVLIRDKGAIDIDVPIVNPNGVTMIAFIQDKVSKEILQVAVVKAPYKVGGVNVGLDEEPTEEAVITKKIELYPNPANGKFYFGLPSSVVGDNYSWKMSDQRGVIVKSGDLSGAVSGQVEVDVTQFANGMYIVVIEGPDKSVAYHKMMVMNHH